jgi:hypothetical protein
VRIITDYGLSPSDLSNKWEAYLIKANIEEMTDQVGAVD